jgi:hypothetical protein
MGGAIFNMQGQLTVSDSTLAENSAVGGTDSVPDHAKGIGGAVFNMSGSFTAVGSTLAKNTAIWDQGAASIYNIVYDGTLARTADVTLRDTLLSDGIGSVDLASVKTAYITPSPGLGSANAEIGQFDLVHTMAAREQGTISGTPLTGDPVLGPLRDNGGPTRTMEPFPESPAIDAGLAFGITRDQRGRPRPFDFAGIPNVGDGSDIGAVESQPIPPGGGDVTPPVLASVSMTNRTFAVNARGAAETVVASRAKKGTAFLYSLSEPARVVFTIRRAAKGRKAGRKCVKPRRSNRKRHRCTRYVVVGRFAKQSKAGENRKSFSGKLGRRKLSPHRYRAQLVATDAAGNHSAARTLSFKVVRR